MFSPKWRTSRRQYGVVHERDVAVPVSAGFTIDCDILRPDSSDRFPAILCFFPFSMDAQLKASMPCDGQVVSFGTSYFAMTAKRVAELKPPSLKTIFAPFAATDNPARPSFTAAGLEPRTSCTPSRMHRQFTSIAH